MKNKNSSNDDRNLWVLQYRYSLPKNKKVLMGVYLLSQEGRNRKGFFFAILVWDEEYLKSTLDLTENIIKPFSSLPPYPISSQFVFLCNLVSFDTCTNNLFVGLNLYVRMWWPLVTVISINKIIKKITLKCFLYIHPSTQTHRHIHPSRKML